MIKVQKLNVVREIDEQLLGEMEQRGYKKISGETQSGANHFDDKSGDKKDNKK